MAEASSRPKCSTCVHFVSERGNAGHCRHGPPTMQAFPMENPLKPGQVGLSPQGFWPPVHAGHWCGQHPDFMVWFSQNRDRFQQIDQLEQEGPHAAA